MLIQSYRPEYAQQAAELVNNGALEMDLITAFQVTRTVFSLWKTMHPEFGAAVDAGLVSSAANAAVVRSVYEMANGYSQDATKIHVTKDGDVIMVPYQERVKKDITAAKFWLANRDPVNWGRNPDDDKTKQGLPSVLNINVLKGMDTNTLQATITALQALLTPNGPQHTGLRRLDAQDAEVIPNDPDFKPKRRRRKPDESPTDAEAVPQAQPEGNPTEDPPAEAAQ